MPLEKAEPAENQKARMKKIKHTVCTVQKIVSDAVGKKGLAHTGVAVEKQVLERIVKVSDKFLRHLIRATCSLTFGESR